MKIMENFWNRDS